MATIPTYGELEHLAKRLDAAPEFDVNKLDGLEGAWVDGNLRVYIAGARAGWEKCASLVRAPSGDVVAVPREDLDEWLTALRCSEPFVACGHDNAQKRLDAIESMTRALRSGEAGKGAIYCGEHTAAEIPAILAAHPGYTLPSSHDF